MMGWNENWPQKSGGDFSAVNTFPLKQTILLLDLSVLNISQALKWTEKWEHGAEENLGSWSKERGSQKDPRQPHHFNFGTLST